jgi:hypothetical protein
MEAQLPVQVVDGHVGQSAKRAIDAANYFVHHAAELLVFGNIRAAGHSNLSSSSGARSRYRMSDTNGGMLWEVASGVRSGVRSCIPCCCKGHRLKQCAQHLC